MTDKRKPQMEKNQHGKRRRSVKNKKPVTMPEPEKSGPEKDADPGEMDYGGMDLKNFRRNLGCGG
jgi:hypothetical protein